MEKAINEEYGGLLLETKTGEKIIISKKAKVVTRNFRLGIDITKGIESSEYVVVETSENENGDIIKARINNDSFIMEELLKFE
jgi:hypothetical protein